MVLIRRMREDERDCIALFVNQIMQSQYHCNAHALPEVVFLALRSREPVGAIALSLGVDGTLPIEEIYVLDYRTFPQIYERAKVVQLGRWIATMPNISEALFCVAVRYAMGRGCRWGIGEMKPKVVRRFRRMGMKVIPLSGEPNIKNIPPDVLPYYLLPPAPAAYLIILREAERALAKRVASLAGQRLICYSDI
jgi:hypothetical protein